MPTTTMTTNTNAGGQIVHVSNYTMYPSLNLFVNNNTNNNNVTNNYANDNENDNVNNNINDLSSIGDPQ